MLLFKSPFFHPAFLIEDQSLQEGCVISRSFDRLGIAPTVRRSVAKVLAPRLPCLHGLEGTGRTVFLGMYVRRAGSHWYRSYRNASIMASIFSSDMPSGVSSVTPCVIAPLFR